MQRTNNHIEHLSNARRSVTVSAVAAQRSAGREGAKEEKIAWVAAYAKMMGCFEYTVTRLLGTLFKIDYLFKQADLKASFKMGNCQKSALYIYGPPTLAQLYLQLMNS